MKLIQRGVALLLALLITGSLAAGVFASGETSIYSDTGQETAGGEIAAPDELSVGGSVEDDEYPVFGTVIDPETGIEYEILSSVEDIIPEDTFTGESGTIQLDDTTTVEYETATEDDRAEVLAEIMAEAASDALPLDGEEAMPEPDGELLDTETGATLYIDFADEGSAVAVSTDDGAEQRTMLYYISENDGVLYSLAPDDLAVEEPVEADEAGRAVISIRRGVSVRLAVIGGYGHEIVDITISPDIPEAAKRTYDFIMEEDITLSVTTTEAAVHIPAENTELTSVQVRERDGVILNDPTVTLPAEESSAGSAANGPRKISGNYWGEISARYEGGGTHPYPSGRSTGIFTVNCWGTYYTGICIDPSYGAPGSGYVNQWRNWYYYCVPIKGNAAFFAAIAASFYSNKGSESGTVAYVNQRGRQNWNEVGAPLYDLCAWYRVIDNSNFGHGFAMYHELLGYLANDWSWDRSVLGSSGVKSDIEHTCNMLYYYCDPNGGGFRQDFYNILYTYYVFYYQSTTAGRQRVAWSLPRTDYGTVRIMKTSTKTGEPLPGCTITLTDINDPDHKFTATTGDDGIAIFEWVTWTTYTVEETVAPENFELSYEPEDIAFTASAYTHTISDRPKTGTLEVVKLDHETKTPLAGATFQIKDENGAVVATATTGEDGKITVEDLYYGDYTYQEIEAPPLFQIDDTIYPFTIEGGDVVTHTREDIRIPGSITVYKSDTSGNPVPGVTFELGYSMDGGGTWTPVYARTDEDVLTGGCTSSGLSNGRLNTDAGGVVKFEGLRADKVIQYRLTEVSTKNGKMLLAETVYAGTLPVDGDSEPIFDISTSVTEGTTFSLPNTGSPGFVLLPMALVSLVLSVSTVRASNRRRRGDN